MAREIYRFSVLTPAGTLQSAPLTTNLPLPPRIVTRVEIRVPPGPRGVLGLQFTSGKLQMIPINAGAFVVADNETLGWDLTDQIDSGAWQLTTYNVGSFDHAIEVRFFTELIPPKDVPALTIIPNAQLGPVAVGH